MRTFLVGLLITAAGAGGMAWQVGSRAPGQAPQTFVCPLGAHAAGWTDRTASR